MQMNCVLKCGLTAISLIFLKIFVANSKFMITFVHYYSFA